MPKPTIVCLTPVLNEAWILERFLKCASLWADHIVVADQGSTDGSREIALGFPKVRLIENKTKRFNEPERQGMLLAEGRRFAGPRVLLALDADEFLSASVLTSPEWESMVHASAGTVISFEWPLVHTKRGELCYYTFPTELPIGFVDDGSEHKGKTIHSFRLPVPTGARTLSPKQVKLMHYCLMDQRRFDSRVRWYQCWEHLNLKRRPIELYRFYHQHLFVPETVVKSVPAEWIGGYEERGIDMRSVNREGSYRWDREVLEFFAEHGTGRFRRLAIWDADWSKLHDQLFPDQPKRVYGDPRSRLDKLAHRWLEHTQRRHCFHANDRSSLWRRLRDRLAEKALRIAGW